MAATRNSHTQSRAQPGRTGVKARSERPSLKAMLAAFDPKRHGGEAMALRPVGREVL